MAWRLLAVAASSCRCRSCVVAAGHVAWGALVTVQGGARVLVGGQQVQRVTWNGYGYYRAVSRPTVARYPQYTWGSNAAATAAPNSASRMPRPVPSGECTLCTTPTWVLGICTLVFQPPGSQLGRNVRSGVPACLSALHAVVPVSLRTSWLLSRSGVRVLDKKFWEWLVWCFPGCRATELVH